VSYRRSSPKIDAIPGDAAGTRRFAVFDNVAAHLTDDRRSAGELSDPHLRRQYPRPLPSTMMNLIRRIVF
jgi:hypothetical protein